MTGRERGFILATTLLVTTLLTVMLTAAFVMISAEFRTTNGSYSSSRALNLAQAGLQSYFSFAHPLSGLSDSTQYTYAGGYAIVVARKVRDSTGSDRALWIVYATGVDSTRTISAGTGRRVVAQLANLDAGVLPARATMVAANGVIMSSSGVNPINGINTGFDVAPGCITPSPPNAPYDTLGLTTPTGGYSGGSGGADVGGEAPRIEYLPTAAAVIDSTYIDWARLVAGYFTPDFYGTLPAANNTLYQSHYFPGNVTIPSGVRRGLLVAGGNVTVASSAHWDGVIIAGGRLDANVNGPYLLHGMVITGLNIATGSSVLANQVRRGSGRVIQWDYCYTRSSVSSLSYLTPIAGTFLDIWDTY